MKITVHTLMQEAYPCCVTSNNQGNEPRTRASSDLSTALVPFARWTSRKTCPSRWWKQAETPSAQSIRTSGAWPAWIGARMSCRRSSTGSLSTWIGASFSRRNIMRYRLAHPSTSLTSSCPTSISIKLYLMPTAHALSLWIRPRSLRKSYRIFRRHSDRLMAGLTSRLTREKSFRKQK